MYRPSSLTTTSGRLVDLLNPKPEDIILDDICEQLSKEARYNGATPGVFYSVAEHLTRGADAVFAETNDELAAACFLLHDFPEAYLRDDTTPKKRALAILAETEFGVLGSSITKTFDSLTERWDVAIHEAAGIPWPEPPAIAALVHRFDQMMLLAEWRDLKRCPMPFAVSEGIEPLPEIIIPCRSWSEAQWELTSRCEMWLPKLVCEKEPA